MFHHVNVDRMNLQWIENLDGITNDHNVNGTNRPTASSANGSRKTATGSRPGSGSGSGSDSGSGSASGSGDDRYHGFPVSYNTWLSSAESDPFWSDMEPSTVWRSAKYGCQLDDVTTPDSIYATTIHQITTCLWGQSSAGMYCNVHISSLAACIAEYKILWSIL